MDPNEPVYCICMQVSYGEMVGCDNPSCENGESTTVRYKRQDEWDGGSGGGGGTVAALCLRVKTITKWVNCACPRPLKVCVVCMKNYCCVP